MNLREKFLENGIPYDDIDSEMIELIDVLNFHLNLKTKFCCYGHEVHSEIHLIFDESVTDEKILKLAEQTGEYHLAIFFYKWVRSSPVKMNWKLNIAKCWADPNSEDKRKHLEKVVDALKACKL